MTRRDLAGNKSLFLMAAGFGLWSIAFATLYGMLSVGCALGWHEIEPFSGISVQRLQVVVLAIAFTLAQGATTWRLVPARRPAGSPARFVRRVAFITALAALGASVFTFAAVLWLSPCL
jgi:hypothetical protein